jgi:hypothetical protein
VNARVRTLDPGLPAASAVAVAGPRVLALGASAAIRALAGPRTEVIDCRGATVLPGLIDPHLHLYALAARDQHLDCAPFTRVLHLLAAVQGRARTLEPGAWVRGEGLDEATLDRLPTARELDVAAPRNPVRLRHRSRHASVLSGRGLRLLGVGGRSARGVVSGIEPAVGRVVGPLPRAELASGFARAARQLAEVGLTTVADATPRTWSSLASLRRAMADGSFPLRVHAMRRLGARAWEPWGRLRPAAVKLMVEEGPGGMAPSPAILARRIGRAAASGAQVAVHCVGSSTLLAALAGFAALPVVHRRGRRHRLEHVAECPPPLVARIRALDLTVVTNPSFVRLRGDVYRRETPEVAQAWLYRARTLAAAGVPLAAASDAPVAPPSPWIGMAAARTRRTASGHVLGGRERVGAPAALALFTRGAAYALRADTLGRLVSGGPADLIVVTPDPLVASPDETLGMRVGLTMVAGEVVWRA